MGRGRCRRPSYWLATNATCATTTPKRPGILNAMSVEQAKPNPNGGKTGTTALESLHVAAEGTNGRNGL